MLHFFKEKDITSSLYEIKILFFMDDNLFILWYLLEETQLFQMFLLFSFQISLQKMKVRGGTLNEHMIK